MTVGMMLAIIACVVFIGLSLCACVIWHNVAKLYAAVSIAYAVRREGGRE